MDELRTKLFYEQKNGYDLIGTEERLAVEDYCKGYMEYLDNSRMEREAVVNAIALEQPGQGPDPGCHRQEAPQRGRGHRRGPCGRPADRPEAGHPL